MAGFSAIGTAQRRGVTTPSLFCSQWGSGGACAELEPTRRGAPCVDGFAKMAPMMVDPGFLVYWLLLIWVMGILLGWQLKNIDLKFFEGRFFGSKKDKKQKSSG